MEVGFNTYYAFRDGETAWVYSKVLHFLHQLTGVTCFSVYPYQLGHENEEAIKSGAFWFYRKLGFRPGLPNCLRSPGERKRRWFASPRIGPRRALCGSWRQSMCSMSSARSRRGNGIPSRRERSDWRCSGGWRKDSPAILRRCGRPPRRRLSQNLQVDPATWSLLEREAFENFALVLLLAPELKRWTKPQKQALVDIIRAKVAADEREYLRLLQQHSGIERDRSEVGIGTVHGQRSC